MTLTCPHCGFAKDIDPARLPDRQIRVTCPRCSEQFPFRKSGIAETRADEAVAPRQSCPACGLEQPGSTRCSGCGVIFSAWEQRQRELSAVPAPVAAPPADLQPRVETAAAALPKAGFWIRVVASLVDSVVVTLIQLVLGALLNLVGSNAADALSQEGELLMVGATWLFGSVLAIAYYVFFTGYCGQTPGKMAVRIKVIRTDGTPLSYGRAFYREAVGKFISSILLGIGYLMVAFDEQKQGLHDRMADTYVIKL